MKANKKISFRLYLLILGILPLTIGVIIASILGYSSVSEEIRDATYEKLTIAVDGLDNYFGDGWDEWIAEGITASDEAYVDMYLSDEIQMTVFAKNSEGKLVRHLSSIKDESGNRISGTEADPEIAAAVYENGQTVTKDGVKINGISYYVCYAPIKNDNGEIVGMGFAGESDADVKAAVSKFLFKVIIGALIVIIACAAIILLIANKTVEAMSAVVKFTERLSEGYINERVDDKSFVLEISEIAEAAKVLRKNLQLIVGDIKTTSGSLNVSVADTNGLCSSSAEGSNQISIAVGELATASQSMAESVQSLNEDIIHIGNNINTIESSVRLLASASRNMEDISDEAKTDILEVLDSSDKSVEAVNNITKHMEELAEAIDEVSDATKLISDISTQTNLLSLNASIEAARAGEVGKGFAVVAGEISSLANQSDDGVKRIDDVVRKVLSLSSLSMELAENIKVIISDEKNKVNATQASFMKLKKEIDSCREQIESISRDAISLAEAKDSAVGAVSDLSAISEENAASTEEVTASIENLSSNINDISVRSDDMHMMSETLMDAVKAFKEE